MTHGIVYTLSWREEREGPNGPFKVRHRLNSPHVQDKGQAMLWLYKQKPYIFRSIELLESLTIRAWDRNVGDRGRSQ